MKYLLDTNVISELRKAGTPNFASAVASAAQLLGIHHTPEFTTFRRPFSPLQ